MNFHRNHHENRDNPRRNRWDQNSNYQPSQARSHKTHPNNPPSRATDHSIVEEQAIAALLTSANENQTKKQESINERKRTHMPPMSHGRESLDKNSSLKRYRKEYHKEEEQLDKKYSFGAPEEKNKDSIDDVTASVNVPKVKANFGLSGALANDDQTGNVRHGITLKFSEPPEARIPNTRWRLYVFKKENTDKGTSKDGANSGELLETLHISKQSSYLFGRELEIADIPVHHPSLSKQHCVLQYRALMDKVDGKLRCKPYLMDLGSTNGTFINGVRLEDARYYELRKGDVITLGASTREYVLLTENTTSTDL